MKKISLSKLESFLKSQCDALRGAGLDAFEYKDYIISMIFLKRVNDQFAISQEKYFAELKQEYPDLSDAERMAEIEQNNSDRYEFYVPVRARWQMTDLPAAFRKENEKKLEDAKKHLAETSLDEQSRNRYLDIQKTAADNLQWRGLLTLTEGVGDALNIALTMLEESNSPILDGVLSSTKFNAVNTKGEKILSDEVLTEMIHEFNRILFTDDNFEFPDMLGAAYEYLIKYFAESAGKKGGEFYTPGQVVELMGKILQPDANAEICDPTVGSGGLLINMRNYVESRYGSARNLSLFGQDNKDSTYKMCRMNMLFHGIRNASIQLGDTLLDPKLVENGQLRTFDIVVANPPFSQNYTTKDMHFKERFINWMSKKKQADFMFVQHMIAVLKNNGRMAVVMPHGVLFRGGEEQKMRKRLIDNGILECVIGLPPALFYGTGIPASILIINKNGAEDRDGVFFINADREYQEGKNQNLLRPEDIEKISYIYTHKIELPKYSRQVTKAELAAEEYNCNIRRYVDNAPEPENQDVQAHLTGGIPQSEVEELDAVFACFPGLKTELFAPLKAGYCRFSNAISDKEEIQKTILASAGHQQLMSEYAGRVATFWANALPGLRALPEKKNIFALSNAMSGDFSAELAKQSHPLLDEYQCRGVFAQYLSDLKYDFKSVVASQWNAELIPEEEILQSQFPEVLEELKSRQARREEIQSMFDEVAELEEDAWNSDDYQVIPQEQIKAIKAEIKENKTARKVIEKEIKSLEKRIKAYQKAAAKKDAAESEKQEAATAISTLEQEKAAKVAEMAPYDTFIADSEAQIEQHVALENELKECGQTIRAIERRKDELVEQARENIPPAEAERLILARWERMLSKTIENYLDAHVRDLQQNVEKLYDKYTITLKQILSDRDAATAKLNVFLKELGYEE